MKVILDAGHGLSTPGKRSPDGLKEYEINRAIASYSKEALSLYDNVQVIYTHSDAMDVPLQTRTEQANALAADCFISIHSNAAGNGHDWHTASGIETYVYTKPNQQARMLADKIHQQLIATTGLINRGIKKADFHVLRETKMPAILVECGFMTNQQECKLLRSTLFQKTCGDAIANGIAQTFSLKKKNSRNMDTHNAKGIYKVQVGAFTEKKHADALAQLLEKQGHHPYIAFEKN
ncbi:N-acetylmuramoyl-L-alanine amidase [Bacillus sp. 1P06AnD]|uniref:N-acetylmuramoyl-L-alanine amidase n=1 Tax=Bacillus sp. 1P06AnD TaxID=3132208 RepID=UPI0039A2B73D